MRTNLKKIVPGSRYQLKITLKWSDPPIWRRVVVPADMQLDALHEVIQIAMGWKDDHLHQFILGSGKTQTYYSQPDYDLVEVNTKTLDERRASVADVAPFAKTKFVYEYDFGDSWLHEILVEKILPADPAFKHPLCVDGAHACPPEDCGGIHGYYSFVNALEDPKHPDHEEIKEWLGEGFDPVKFSIEIVILKMIPC
jgi:hypothetical protein